VNAKLLMAVFMACKKVRRFGMAVCCSKRISSTSAQCSKCHTKVV